jgi:lysophospholipase-2
MTQWFDFFTGTSPPAYTDHQLESLRAAVEHVLEVIDYEIDVVGIPPERILLGGLSQGCATALFALLMGGRKLGGFVGMSGWMPFAETIRNMLVGVGMPMRPGPPPVVTRMPPGVDVGKSPPDFEDPPWEELEELKLRERAEVVASLRKKVMKLVGEMDEGTFKQMLETKVWLGHGDADTVVTYETGRKAYTALKALGMDVIWKRYECWIHWYKVSFCLFWFPMSGC